MRGRYSLFSIVGAFSHENNPKSVRKCSIRIGPEGKDFKKRLDGLDNFGCAPRRRPGYPRRCIRTGNEAQPEGSGFQCPEKFPGKFRTACRAVEDMKTARIESSIESFLVESGSEKIAGDEPAGETCLQSLYGSHLDRHRCNIDTRHTESPPRKPEGCRPRSASRIENR